MRWMRIVVGSLIAELLPIAALIAVVAAFGPGNAADARLFAERVGRWVGPISGFVATLAVGYWVARRAPQRPRGHGMAIGVGAMILDVSILLASSPPFDWVFVVSNLGRLLAGWLAGSLAASRSATIPARSR
jgi:hypothetical protein